MIKFLHEFKNRKKLRKEFLEIQKLLNTVLPVPELTSLDLMKLCHEDAINSEKDNIDNKEFKNPFYQSYYD